MEVTHPSSPEMPKNTKYHFVHLLTVFAQSVNIFVILNANCLCVILLLLAVLLPPRGSVPPYGREIILSNDDQEQNTDATPCR